MVFCFVLYHQSGGLTYTRAFKNIVVSGLKNRSRLKQESTYTRENMVTFKVLIRIGNTIFHMLITRSTVCAMML